MKQLFLFLLTFILTINFIGLSSAQTTSNDEKNMDSGHELFLRYLKNNADYNTQLQTKINRLFELTFQDCKKIEASHCLAPTTLLTPAFRDKNLNRIKNVAKFNFDNIHPTYGQWVDKHIVRGCGKTTQLNFLVTAYDLNEKPEILPVINGQTRLEIIDQSNAENVISQKVNDKLGCFDSVFVLGSRFLGYKSANDNSITKSNENAGWYERWVVEACNNYHIINLAILPDAEKRFEFIAQIAPPENN